MNDVRVEKRSDCEVIHRPNELKQKTGGLSAADGKRLVAGAEAGLHRLSGDFGAWLEQEMKALESARTTVRELGLSSETTGALATRSLDLKGLGRTYGFPLVSRIAASLFKLLDEADPAATPMLLVDAHIDGMRAVIRGQIRDPAHPVGLALADQLEQHVREYAAAR